MSQALFPTLPGLHWPVMRTVLAPKVHVRTTPSEREFRARNATQPRYLFTLGFEFLRSSAATAEWQSLLGFYNLRGGDFENFLFLDAADNTATAENFGVGNGVTTQFQLLRSLGSFLEPVYGFTGTPQIYLGGTLVSSGYTLSNTGLVTFATAPGAAVALTWTGTFCWRVRFAKGQQEFEQFMSNFFSAKKVELMSVKDEL